MWRNLVILVCIELLRVVFLHISEVSVELNTLLEVLGWFMASDVSEIVEIPENVHTSLQKSLPVYALKL